MSDSNSVVFFKRPRFWRSLSIQLLLLAVLYAGFQFWQSRNAITGAAPAINATLLNGQQVSLNQYRGQAVLVHFWASWCPICRFEESTISSLSKDYPVLTFASQSGDQDEVNAYIAKQNIDFPVIMDESGDWAQHYGITGYPTSFIIDSEGNIFDVEVGYTSYWGLRLRLFWASL